MTNIYYRHAALQKVTLIACLLFVAAWFCFAVDADSRPVIHANSTGYAPGYDNSLFIDALQAGYLGSSIERARKLRVP